MASIRVEGIDRTRSLLASVAGKLPTALANGINRTASAIEQAELNEMENVLDRPTPFTMNAIRVYPAQARRATQNAIINIQPIQRKYLRYQILGGTLPTIIEPISIKLNQYGNIVGKAEGLKGIAARGKRRFVATINGRVGVWERLGSELKLLVQVGRQRRREPRFDFYGVGQRVADARLTRDVNAAIVDVLRGR